MIVDPIIASTLSIGEKSLLHVRHERRWFTAGESPAREQGSDHESVGQPNYL
jgi:hypothetical protein